MIGKADANSSIMGRHKNKTRVATKREMGELYVRVAVSAGYRPRTATVTHYIPAAATTAGIV